MLTLMQNEEKKSKGRNMNTDTSAVVSHEELNKRYATAKCFLAGVVFSQSEACLNPEVRDKINGINDVWRKKEAAKVNNKKKKCASWQTMLPRSAMNKR